jgi:CSLREA domain-containing protein
MSHSDGRRLSARRLASLLLLLAAAGCLLSPSAPGWLRPSARAAGSVFVVNSNGDGPDANTSDGVCDDGAGRCTLRAAIQQANATPGADTINFQIGTGVQTIVLGSTLPDVSDPAVIDGSTQPGYGGSPLVEILGQENASPAVSWALHVTAGGSTVRALALGRFSAAGILLGTAGTASAGGNKVESCYVGLRADGVTPSAVGGACVQVADSPDNTVGGTNPGARNVLSACSAGVAISGPNSAGNLVQGNYIGTNAAGTAAIPNRGDGVSILFASNNTVGGDTAAARNVISGNSSEGVRIEGGSGPGSPPASLASGNAVKGNYIGTNAAGTAAIPNTSTGVRAGGVDTVVGGLTATPGAAPGNLIAGQFTNLFLIGTGAVVRGNLIGTDVTGATRFVTGGSFGIACWGPNSVIGGTQAGARNVISGHAYGISIANSGAAVIQGNYIGTDLNGTAAVGNITAGVEAVGNASSQIGGAAAGAGNLISGNGRGVWLHSNTSVVQGNLIGTDASGTSPLPNGHGVFISSTARNDVIGGTAPGEGNRIAFNTGAGIVVAADTFVGQFSTGNALRGNSIFSNGLLGIDLLTPPDNLNTSPLNPQGVTLNDPGDADAGPNNLQNAPAVLSADSAGGTTSVQGRLDSAPNQTYNIDIYANPSCDASGHGEGQTYVGSTAATTDAAGSASFAASFTTPASGQVFTATATDAAGNTSEFSVCYEANAPGTVQFTAAAFDVAESKGAATVVVTRTLGTAGAASVDYATSDGTAAAGADYTPASGTLNFAPGEATKTFNVTVLNDALNEDMETVQLTLSNPTGGISVGAGGTSSLRIADDDPLPRVSVTGGIVAEGNAGTASAVFNLTLNAPSGRAVTVSYTTENASAFAPQDYQPASGTVVFNPGETSRQVTVGVNGDTDAEPDEAFGLRVSNPVNAVLNTPPGGGTILRAFAVIWDDDSPGIHFSAPNYSVGEADGGAVIRVVRRGDASAAASVAYSANGVQLPNTNPGFASQRTDFTPTFGTLDFAPGEAEKSFVVPVNDDAYVEVPELVTLRLDLTPETFGVDFTAHLFIDSDDAQPPTAANNPLDETQFFVRQHYHDFLSREPDAEGLAFWVGDIERCGADAVCREVQRINVSAAFFLSIEFQNTGYQVFRIYRATFTDSFLRPRGMPQFLEFLRDTQRVGRGVVVGQAGWEERLRQNKEEFARQWVAGAEFNASFSGLTGEQFVDKLFANSGVTPTAAERAAALAAYGSGDTAGRAAALLSVTDSGSVFYWQYNPAFVYMQYVGYLRRAPDEAPDFNLTGFDFWLGKLDSFTEPGEDARDETVAIRRVRRAEMVKAFLSSIEYRQRFGTP